MKKLKKAEKFVSKIAGKRIKVVEVMKQGETVRQDRVLIVDLAKNNHPIKGSERQVYADSIRRRYFM
jgi:hypothetical protein